MTKVELHLEALQELHMAFDIKYAMNCRDFDTDPQILKDSLKKFSGQSFGPRDKILLVHMDTDYYDPLLVYGLTPVNVIRIFCSLDIPLHAMLFVTNHFGIKQEFDSLLKNHHDKDRPHIIETLLSPLLFGYTPKQNFDITVDQIEKQGLCMMNRRRSHRVALWNFLLDNKLLDKVAVSQNFNE